MVAPHDRELDHYGVEPDSVIVLSDVVGPYQTGSPLHTVLADMATRIGLLEGDHNLRAAYISADARLKMAAASILADAYITNVPIHHFVADAYLGGHIQKTFSADAFFNGTPYGAVTVLMADIDSSQTTITVNTAYLSGFPMTAFVIAIGNEQMEVTAGFGTGTWTVTRGYNGTTPASHQAGDYVVFVQC